MLFAKQKAAYEVRCRDWSSGVCSSDLGGEKGAYAPPYVGGNDAGDAGGALLIDDDEIERAMLGNFDGADNLLAAPAPEPVGPDVADDEDIDFSTFVEAREDRKSTRLNSSH